MKNKTKKKGNLYVDGFVLVVPKKNMAIYKRMASAMGKLCRKYGVLEYKECVGEDLNPNMGGMKFMTFPRLTKTKRGETVVFSYIVYKSRKHGDETNKKIMKDPVMAKMPKKMPFDMKRMTYGGFKVLVNA